MTDSGGLCGLRQITGGHGVDVVKIMGVECLGGPGAVDHHIGPFDEGRKRVGLIQPAGDPVKRVGILQRPARLRPRQRRDRHILGFKLR